MNKSDPTLNPTITPDIEPEGRDSEEDHYQKIFSFEKLPLSREILQGIKEAGFERCTPIQAQVLPQSLEGKDILGKAQTGTGKTAAFLLTLFHYLTRFKSSQEAFSKRPANSPAFPKAVVLAPTRELALQIVQDGVMLGKFTHLQFASLIGGIDYEVQHQQLAKNPEIIVATPGRLIDFLKSRKVSLSKISHAVIDEADRMLDMGFLPDIRYLMHKMPPYHKRQTLLFSATLTFRVTELSYSFMNNPVEIDITPEQIVALNVEEKVYHVGMEEKLPLLLGQLKNKSFQRVMIFCNTKSGCEWLGFKLKGNGYSAEVLTGDVHQKKRLSIVRRFKANETQILIATDVASRGLHVEEVSHVINFDVPEDAENYVHRIGRTARAGMSGMAITFSCERYATFFPALEELIGHKIPVHWHETEDLVEDRAGMFRGKKRGPAPARSRSGRPGGPSRPSGKQNRRRRPHHRSGKNYKGGGNHGKT